MKAHHEVLPVLSAYIEGLYEGDVDLLRKVFHPKAALFGVVRGRAIYVDIDAWLAAVGARESPKASGEKCTSNVLSVDVTDDVGFARVHSPMLGFNYFDYLSLIKVDREWVIGTKTYVHVEAENTP